MNRSLSRLLLVAVAVASSLPLQAQNILPNGNFSSMLSGWTTLGPFGGPGDPGMGTWDSDSGSPTSDGAASILVDEFGTGFNQVSLFNCVDVSVGTLSPPWDFGVRRRVVQNDPLGSYTATMVFFALPACNNAITSTQVILTQTGTMAGFVDGAPATFDQLEGTVASEPLPGNPTQSVRMQLTVTASSAGQPAEALFDQAYFGGDGTTPVTLQSFGVE